MRTAARVDPAHGGDARVIGVEDGEAVRRQCRGKLGLCLGDALDAPGPLEMCRVDGEHDPTSGRASSARRAISPTVYMLIFEHRGLVRVVQAQQGHRQTGLGVQVALVAEGTQGA